MIISKSAFPDGSTGLFLAWWTLAAAVAGTPTATAPKDESRTAAEWVEIMRQEAQAEQGDAAYSHLLRAAAVWIMSNDQDGLGKYARYAGADDVASFEQWLATEGRSLQQQWLEGKPVSAEKKRLLYLAQAAWYGRRFPEREAQCREAWRQHQKDGKASPGAAAWQLSIDAIDVFRRGYLGEPLSVDDIQTLRLMRIVKERLCNTPKQFGPYYMGLARTTEWRAGEVIPDFLLAKVEEVWQRPTYHDQNDENPFDFLGAQNTAAYLAMMAGYEAKTAADGKRSVEARRPAITPERASQYQQISKLYGEKPVVLMVMDAKDVFSERCFPIMETVYHAWRDRAVFRFIQTTQSDQYRLRSPFGYLHSWWEQEEDAARILRLEYLMHPHVSVPGLLDTISFGFRNAYQAHGGDGGFLILDLDGQVQFRKPQGNAADGLWWADELEQELVLLLARGGKHDPQRGQIFSGDDLWWSGEGAKPAISKAGYRSRADVTYRAWIKRGNNRLNYGSYDVFDTKQAWLTGHITAVKSGEVLVRVEANPDEMIGYRLLKKEYAIPSRAEHPLHPTKIAEVTAAVAALDRWVKDSQAEKPYRFTLDEKSELRLNGDIAVAGDLKAGDMVSVLYDYNTHVDPSATPAPAIILRASRWPVPVTPSLPNQKDNRE